MTNEEYVKAAGSKELAARIVVYRLLKIDKELAIMCMSELSAREKAGDTFDYNTYIETELANSPKPYAEKTIMDFLKSVSKNGIG